MERQAHPKKTRLGWILLVTVVMLLAAPLVIFVMVISGMDIGGIRELITIFFSLASLILPLSIYKTYQKIVIAKNEAEHALESINIHLRKRLSTIPNLFKTAQHYLDNEKELLIDVANIREHNIPASIADSKSIQQSIKDAAKIDEGLSQIRMRMEQYPELRSVTLFQDSMKALERIEADIAASRRLYNMTARDMNILFDMFPSSVVVKLLQLPRLHYYIDPDAAKIATPIEVSDFMVSRS